MEINKSSNLLETPVQYLKGVGPRRAKAFDSIEIKTLKDLIYYFPENIWIVQPFIPLIQLK